jgi:hypothetical protein
MLIITIIIKATLAALKKVQRYLYFKQTSIQVSDIFDCKNLDSPEKSFQISFFLKQGEDNSL